jgi:rhodanese-related sulfurtransferase
MNWKNISAETLRAWVLDGEELAILDAREEGEFGTAHLFWAVPCPLSRAELRAPALLPRKSVRIVCVDDGRGLASRLAAMLAKLGYTDLSVLDGGIESWASAGFVLFSGVNVPSKAFGEWVEHHYGTESIDPNELKQWMDSGKNIVVLDSRPFDEFTRMSIPSGINVPGGELVYRIGDIAPDQNTTVVVNCAGRTRSIMGAESLRRAGIPNRVVALRNGTMGWELAGYQCARGRTERFSPGTPASMASAQERARAFAEQHGVRVIGADQLSAMEADPGRSLFVLDVRDPAEFHAGHRSRCINAPGGQLVQATDRWIGVRNARIALIDDTGVRSNMAAGWLRQMGYADVYTVENALLTDTETASAEESDAPAVPTISVSGLATMLDGQGSVVIVDLARSIDFREGHIPGALWGIRSRLAALAGSLQTADHVVVTCPDGVLARLAVDEIKPLANGTVRALEGGTNAWHQFGRPLQRDRSIPPDEACVDVYLRPYDRNSGIEEAMQAYLSWEIDLVNEIRRDGSVHFGAKRRSD